MTDHVPWADRISTEVDSFVRLWKGRRWLAVLLVLVVIGIGVSSTVGWFRRGEAIDKLQVEKRTLERELHRHNTEIRELATHCGTDSVATDLMADIQDRIRIAEQRATEPCGPSFFDSLMQATKFMETAGGIKEDEQISNMPWLQGQMAELKSSAIPTKQRGSANRLFLSMTKAMENMVMDTEEQQYVRMFAWLVLIMWWSTLRWDDTQWMVQDSMELSERGFKAEFRRTKTTGKDKKVSIAFVVVSAKAWLSAPEWLAKGFSGNIAEYG